MYPSQIGAVPLSKPAVGVASSLDPAVLSNRRVVDRLDWTEPRSLRHAFAATYESDADLPADQSRAVQLLLGHTKLESTVRYLGIEVDDALEIAEQTEV